MSEHINPDTGELVVTPRQVNASPIRTSTDVNELYGALAEAQASMPNPEQSKSIKYQNNLVPYSDLTDCLKVARPALAKVGIALIQMPSNDTTNPLAVSVTTRLAHKSGQYIEGTLSSQANTGRMTYDQAIGTAITYLKRYALCSMLGIAGDPDIDGNELEAPNRGDNGNKSNLSEKGNTGNKRNTGNTQTPQIHAPVEGDPKLLANIEQAKTVAQVQGYLRQATNKQDTTAMQAANAKIQQMGAH